MLLVMSELLESCCETVLKLSYGFLTARSCLNEYSSFSDVQALNVAQSMVNLRCTCN